MSRLFASASSQYATVTNGLGISDPPLTLSCWMRPTSTGVAHGLMTLGTSGSGNHYNAIFVQTNNTLQARSRTTANSGSTSAGTVSAGVWAHCAGVFASVSSRVAYLNGTAATEETTTRDTTAPNFFAVGQLGTTAATLCDCGIADAAVWNVALSANEITALVAGVCPLRIRPLSLLGYWPLWGFHSSEIDLTANAHSLTLNGSPSSANGPPVEPFSRRLWMPTAPLIEVAAAGGNRRRRLLIAA